MSTESVGRVQQDVDPGGGAKPRNSLLAGLRWYHLAIAALVIVALVYFNMQTGGVFLSQRNLTLLLKQAAILGVVSAGMVVLIIGRQIDLSAGMAVYLVSVVVAQLSVTFGMPLWVAVAAGVAVGLALGAFQGLMVAKFAIPAFVVTLAGSMIFKGVGYTWTNATAIGPVPKELIWLSEGYIPPVASAILIAAVGALAIWSAVRRGARLGKWENRDFATLRRVAVVVVLAGFGIWLALGYNGLPMAVVIAGVTVFIVSILLSSSPFGRGVYAVGGNPQAAHLAGLKVPKFLLSSFVLMGVIYGVAGLLMTARLGGAAPTAGQLLELDAIAAAVIGGTSFAGGIGRIPGALLGALLLTGIDNVMSLMNVSSFLQMVIKGAILLAAVWFDLMVRSKKRKK